MDIEKLSKCIFDFVLSNIEHHEVMVKSENGTVFMVSYYIHWDQSYLSITQHINEGTENHYHMFSFSWYHWRDLEHAQIDGRDITEDELKELMDNLKSVGFKLDFKL